MSARRLLAAACALVALLIGVLVWKLRDTPSAVPAPGSASTAQHETAHHETAAHHDTPALPAPPAGEPAGPQPVPLDPAATPPPTNAPISEPAPAQTKFTREETIAKREADLELLDQTKTRLEGELASAKANKDATAAHDLEVRLGRIADLKKKRASELERIRAGGELPP